jgi:hypothetical protein
MRKIAIERRSLLGVTLGAALLSAAPISLHLSPATAPLLALSRADARIGRPLSPGSIAGVHRRAYRRTARRAYYGGAAAIGAAGAYYGLADNNYHGSGDSLYGSSGYTNLYNYSPEANAGTATNTAADHATNESSTEFNVQNSPELYAACLFRTYAACPQH